MKPGVIRVPIEEIGNESWAHLGSLAERHEFCAEKVDLRGENFPILGNHRVRRFSVKKSVYWKVPQGVPVDISQIQAATPARRNLPNLR